ncbi:MAG: HEAT repeat domain-containing protein, partial [Phycisphaerae bacterium]
VVLYLPTASVEQKVTTSVEQEVESRLAEMRAEERELTRGIVARLPGEEIANSSAPDWLWQHALADLTANAERIISELAALGPPAVPRLLEALKSTRPSDRCAALFALARIGDPQAVDAVVPMLLARLDEKQPLLRLTQLGPSLPFLPVSKVAVSSRTDRPASRLPQIVEELLVRQPRGYEDQIERFYVSSYDDVVIGYPRFPPREETVRQLSLQVQRHALAIERDTLERVALIRLLGGIGDRRAVPALVRQLGPWDASLREQALGALGRIGAEPAVRPLFEILEHQRGEQPVRRAAAGALARIGGPAALEALKQHLDNPDPAVAEIARGALNAATQKAEPAGR